MDHPAHGQITMSSNENRELARLATAMAGVLVFFTLAGVVIVLETGDLASAAGAAVTGGFAALLIQGRRQALRGQGGRAAALLIVTVLVAVLVSAPIPPPVPALATAPIMAVAFALSFLRGRRLAASLIAAWVVSLIAAIFNSPSIRTTWTR